MINFDKGIELPNKFGGSEKKTTLLLDNIIYMIKLPDPIKNVKIKDVMSYKNNQYSEHIGSSIFNSCGINSQETKMGYYTTANGKQKIVAGCKDFTQNGETLYEMQKLANQVNIDGERMDATIENAMLIIEENKAIKNKDAIKAGFWNMFVVDALIGNKDRHLGNWGVLEKNGEMIFAPIYDCGSALGALLDNEGMEKILNSPSDFKNEEYNILSCYRMENKRVLYHEIFKNPPKGLSEAIKRIVPKINKSKIYEIVNSTEQMLEIRKEYLKKAINLRYEQILIPSYNKILEKDINLSKKQT